MSDEAKRLVGLARQRVSVERQTHWEGCEREHRECLIQRMADYIERAEARVRELAQAEKFVAIVRRYVTEGDAFCLLDSPRSLAKNLQRHIAELDAARGERNG